jgi:hypothetical protein
MHSALARDSACEHPPACQDRDPRHGGAGIPAFLAGRDPRDGRSADRLEGRQAGAVLGDKFLERYGPEPGQGAVLGDANRPRRHAELMSGLFRGHSGQHPEHQ